MMILLLTSLLQLTRGQDVTIDSLDGGPGLLPFKLGPTKIVAHYHSFLTFIDLNTINKQVEQVKSQLFDLKSNLSNKTLSLYDPHIEHLNIKLNSISDQLKTFEPNRAKRGLIDGLGSVVKSISGNLDYSDAIKYDHAIKVLQDNEFKLESELNNHISLNKEWVSLNEKTLGNIVKNQDKMSTVLNAIMMSDSHRETELTKYAHLAQHLLILGDNIEDLSQELYKLENTLSFIRASSTPHSIVSLENLKSMLSKIRILYSKDEILDVDYRDFYDIIKLGYFYVGDRITIVIKIPIAFPQPYDLYRLSIIPNKNHNFLIPTSPYIAISGKDHKYIETECPKINSWFLCQATPNYSTRDEPDCIQQLIIKQEIHRSCKQTAVTLMKEALEQLDDQHYTLYLPTPTKVKISCRQEQYRTLQGSFLVIVPLNCHVKTPEFTIANTNAHIKGHVVKIMEMPQYDESRHQDHPLFTLNTMNLENLHAINTKISLQSPVKLNDATEQSLYHTTIPLYVVILSLVAFIIAVASRRLRTYCLRKKTDVIESHIDTAQGIYAIPDTRSINPSEIKVDHRNISATISNKVLK
ncbi:hypothetical protein ABMA27_003414 [Loxostege sticticalis]|uniref:Envelope protein n=1 Tax=Loxostege sticticalis TaxID=481309 RepID=A0ABR3HT24_LOXSC